MFVAKTSAADLPLANAQSRLELLHRQCGDLLSTLTDGQTGRVVAKLGRGSGRGPGTGDAPLPPNRAAAPALASALAGFEQCRSVPTIFPLALTEPPRKPVQRMPLQMRRMAPVIAELRAAGIRSLNGIAAALNARGVRTPQGRARWYASQVRRLLKRLAG